MAAQDQNPLNDLTGLEKNRLIAALSYLGILVLIPLFFAGKDDPFVKFHARQGLVILIAYILVTIAVGWIPVVGNLVWLLIGIVNIVGLVQALMGKWWKIPVIGDIAAKFKV